MRVDLHCHSSASDGLYEPLEVYHLALAAGVQLLALTDHDTVAGVRMLQDSDQLQDACRLLPGIELSCLWRKRNVHVVGLGIDTRSPVMDEAVSLQMQVRMTRAQRIAERLARRGVPDALQGALAIADGAVPCRPHFAQDLVARKYCRDSKAAFSQYLGGRHMSGLEQDWPALDVVVDWIKRAGGVAVLAHPEAYSLTRTKLRELVVAFSGAGGRALELPAQDKPGDLVALCEQLCREFSLAISVGSDFHGPVDGWRRLGRTPALVGDLPPVWELLEPALPFSSDEMQ